MTMTTELTIDKPKAEPEVTIRYSVTEETVKPLAEKYLKLTINGIEDKAGHEIVKAAQIECRDARNIVENERVAAKAEYLEAGRKVDSRAKTIQALIKPVEDHLLGELKRIKDAELAIVTKQLDDQQKIREQLIDDIGGIPAIISASMQANFVRVAEEAQFVDWLANLKRSNEMAAKAEKDRLAAEALQKAENERLAAEKAAADKKEAEERESQRIANKKLADELAEQKKKLDDQEAAQKAAQDKIDAENKRLADLSAKEAQDKADAEAKVEQDRIAAEEKAKTETYGGVYSRRSWMYDSGKKPEVLPELQKDAAAVRKFIDDLNSTSRPDVSSYAKSWVNAGIESVLSEAYAALYKIAERIEALDGSSSNGVG